ncbi:MAG: hypothetical protein ACP6IP_00815 [Candidatus Njordarchaeia archaeon]
MSDNVENIFKKLLSLGIKNITFFTHEGKSIKSTMDEEKTEKVINLALGILEQAKQIISRLSGSTAPLKTLKATTENGTLHLIIGKNHILAYLASKMVSKELEKFIEVADKIDELFK